MYASNSSCYNTFMFYFCSILKNTSSESCVSYYKCIRTSENSGAKPYVTVSYFYNGNQKRNTSLSGDGLNCQTYAFFVDASDTFYQFTNSDWNYCANTTVENALARTKLRMVDWLNVNFGSGKWRTVSSYDADLAEDEWLVCMRVGVGKVKDANFYDYHFWYRSYDGYWHNKHGSGMIGLKSSEGLGYGLNPSVENNSSGWAYNDVTNFYSSETVYYAVRK